MNLKQGLNLAHLTQLWREKKSFDFTGGLAFDLPEKSNKDKSARAFNFFLHDTLAQNPDVFKNFSNEEVVDVLMCLDKVDPYTNVLTALYSAYDPERNHELCAWELGKRIEFFKALDQDPKIRSITDRWVSSDICPSDEEKKELADYQHTLQTRVYESDRAVTSPYDVPKPPTGEYGKQNIWNASFYRSGNTLYYNTYSPQDSRELKCSFREEAKDFQSTIAHDTDHTVQYTIAERVMRFHQEAVAQSYRGDDLNNYMVDWVAENLPGGLGNGINQMILKSDEMRNFGLLMHYSVQGNYYLSQKYANGEERPGVTFKIYKTNPSEHHTYDFQDDLDRFLAADAQGRQDLLSKLSERKNEHLSMTAISVQQIKNSDLQYHQPQLAAA